MKAFLRHFCLLSLCMSTVACAGGAEERGLLMVSGGMSGVFDTERNPVVMVDYRFAKQWKGMQPWAAMGWATDGAVFVGGGAVYTVPLAEGAWTLSAGTGPGYYERHQGDDLGSHLEFCTFAEIAHRLSREHRIVLRLVHISNGGLTERNPGAELLMLGYAMPLP